MSRSSPVVVAALLLGATVASAAPPTVVTRVQHRSVFGLVGGHKTDLRQLCGDQEATAVEFKHTAADFAAAVFSGLWYTPVHVRVTCSSSS